MYNTMHSNIVSPPENMLREEEEDEKTIDTIWVTIFSEYDDYVKKWFGVFFC